MLLKEKSTQICLPKLVQTVTLYLRKRLFHLSAFNSDQLIPASCFRTYAKARVEMSNLRWTNARAILQRSVSVDSGNCRYASAPLFLCLPSQEVTDSHLFEQLDDWCVEIDVG